MKFRWEDTDIKGGMVVGKDGRVERWMIGQRNNSDGRGITYAMVSLSDGQIVAFHSKAELAIALTRDQEVPVEYLIDPQP